MPDRPQLGGGFRPSFEDDSMRSWACGCYEDQGGEHFCLRPNHGLVGSRDGRPVGSPPLEKESTIRLVEVLCNLLEQLTHDVGEVSDGTLELKALLQAAAAPSRREPTLLGYVRLLELCAEHDIHETDTLKHRLEDWDRWSASRREPSDLAAKVRALSATWRELARRARPLESAPLTAEKRKGIETWMWYSNRATELDALLAGADARQEP